MIKLHIPNYEGECYYYKTINCVDAALAVASGYFSYDNYFYYCAYYSLHSIWTSDFDFALRSRFIAEKLGLELNNMKLPTRESLFKQIRDILAKGSPIIVCNDYFYMFYCDFNYLERHGKHGIIVCGIDDEKATVTVMDCAHISFDSTYKYLTLTQDIFWDIWKKSNDYFNAENQEASYEILHFTSTLKNPITSPYLLLQDTVHNKYISNSDMIIYQMLFNNDFNILFSDFYKRDYVDSIKAIFDIFDKLITTQDIGSELSDCYNNVKKDYLFTKNVIFLKILKKYHKNQSIGKAEKDKLIEEINSNNSKLESLLNQIYAELSQGENTSLVTKEGSELFDYARDASVSASSELVSYGMKFSAERAINGRYEDFTSDMWASEDVPGQHWLLVDVGKPIHAGKVIIIHDFRSVDLFLVDFTVQGSMDSNNWCEIDNVRDNTKSHTTHYCFNKEFRYFRILITKPSKLDNMARIFGVECWGY